LTVVDRWCRIVVKGEETMLCDNNDYLNYEDIEDLYENDIVFENKQEELEDLIHRSSWEYDYHNLTEELVDD
jgi:hypothetical protein